MRKKLFAVIMSAMMMITFMPAMAFAWGPAPTQSVHGFTADGVAFPDGDVLADTYDGAEHAVVYNIPATVTGKTLVGYTMAYKASDYETAEAKFVKTDAPKVKAAGYYVIRAFVKNADTVVGAVVNPGTTEVHTAQVHVLQRPVWVAGFNTTKKVKAYDGKGYALSDKDFTITTEPKTGETEAQKKAREAKQGLVPGDTLFTNAFTTSPNVGEYNIEWNKLATNANYEIHYNGHMSWACKVEITKATNYVTQNKINKTYKAKALKNAKQSFKLNGKAKFGTVKYTKAGGSGWLGLSNGRVVVKKGAPKGTYKIKVTTYVDEADNWYGAEKNTVINVKVR